MPREGMDARYTHHGPRGEGGAGVGEHMMRSPQGGLSAGNGRLKVVACPRRGSDPQVDIPGPKSRRLGGFPHRRYGVSAWTHLANGEGCCPPLCGPDTEQ